MEQFRVRTILHLKGEPALRVGLRVRSILAGCNYAMDHGYDLLINIYDNKGNKDKVKVYEDKFNGVEKVHQ